MKLNIPVTFSLTCILCLCGSLFADWMRMDPPPDVDKSAHGHVGTGTCWQATAANILAGAGYGEGETVQERADAIYLQMVDHFGTDVGWPHRAIKWWLRSEHNTQGTESVVKKYGNTYGFRPWRKQDLPEFLANELRDGKLAGLLIRWPTADVVSIGQGGHAITLWGDTEDQDPLTNSPERIYVTDSDNNEAVISGDVREYSYDSYTSPNPSGPNEGDGWYINYSTNHPYIKSAVTLEPLAQPRKYSMIHAAVISCRIQQDDLLNPATDLHYTVRSDQEIISFYSVIDWPQHSGLFIQESGNPRTEITFDWDLSENPVPYSRWITATTTVVKPVGSTLDYIDMHFTYPGDGISVPITSWSIDTPLLSSPEEISNICGGYLVVSFDLLDPAGGEKPKVIAQYRLVDEYDYTQNPEQHQLHLSGPSGYEVANLKLGHSYGLIDDEELWEFNDWKTLYAQMLPLDSAVVDIDWDGKLPYPDPELVTAVPDSPKCTYYYDEDLNKDCEVDLLDFQMLAAKWLMTTIN